MTNSELLATVRVWQENGGLAELAKGDDVSAILAQFAQAGLKQKPVAIIEQSGLDYIASGADATVWGPAAFEKGDTELFAIPALFTSADADRAERAAKAVVQWLYEGMDGATVNIMAINIEAIILSVLLGEE
jgi:hypothetical protein